MDVNSPGDWISIGVAIWMVCYGISVVVRAFWRKGDGCQCEDHDLAEMEQELDRHESAIAEIRLQMQPETARRIDAFLGDPSTGVRAERPVRGPRLTKPVPREHTADDGV